MSASDPLGQRANVKASVSASEERLCALVCERVLVDDVGVLYCQPTLAKVYDVNVVRQPTLQRGRIDEALRHLWRAAEKQGLSHLFFAGDDLDPRDGLGDALRTRGFVSDTLLCMTLPPDGWRVTLAPRDLGLRPEPADDELYRLYDRVHQDEAWYTPAIARDVTAALCRRRAAGAVRLFGAWLDGQLVGALGLSWDGTAASLVAVATDPARRNRGIGKALAAYALAAAAAQKPKLIYLLTRQLDWPQRFYRRLGFVDAFRFDSYSAERGR